jgi:enoyl-CoA hydratase
MAAGMTDLLSYKLTDGIARIAMNDGKVNVMSFAMSSALTQALDRAERDRAVVILTSDRSGIFTAGFDVKVLGRHDPHEVFEMVRAGADLAARLLSYPLPVIAACPGHAFPMGAFLLLACDVRLGVDGPFQIGFNEVAIGIPVPTFGLELGRHRLQPPFLHRTALTGEMFGPQDAVSAGFLDRLVSTTNLSESAHSVARTMSQVNLAAFANTKMRLKQAVVSAVRRAIDAEITLKSYQDRTAANPQH